ncbi:hypothetical protein M9H77_29872 [Catharanthus roseus]|uniref:Uncharacterized protein n=1 Tax=Catharanthus roseus TaxID=4058 RepID=A0ACB9ZXJ0_CATRO|nr:hypothetical protein M9H77_29872 [Catharanthus roseus]
MFNKVGILCSHCLRIFNILYVQAILDKYILNRWTKDIDLSLGSSSVGDEGKVSKNDIVGYSAWTRKMLRKFSDLIFPSELNINARECREEEFRMLKDNNASEVGHYYVDDLDNEVGSSKIKDPKKNIVEIKYNQAKGKRKSALTHASRIKIVVQLSMNNKVLGRDLNDTSSECYISLGTSSCGNEEPLNTLQQFINFMYNF